MSKDIIYREDAINLLWYFQDECCSAVVGDFEKLSSADRPQGEWNPYYTKRENNDIFNCKLCGTTFIVMQGKDNMNFCPNCGARMKGADDEAD